MNGLRDRRVLIFGLVLVAAGIGVGSYVWWTRRAVLPGRDTPVYKEYQRKFQIGVAAMEAGRMDLARESFDRAIELVPDEPAAWANRGLLQLRNNDLDEAAKDLKRAQSLAPDSAEIAAIAGLLAEKQGKFTEAIAQLEKSVEKNPRDLRSLFLLAELVSKERLPDADGRYQRLMEEILKVQPNNLLALVERAGAAFRSKDQAALKDTIERFSRLEPNWGADSRKAFREISQAAPGDFLEAWADLKRVLVKERGFSRDSLSLRANQNNLVGAPVQAFLRLEPMRPLPAAADHELTFKIEEIAVPGKEQARWDVVLPVWMISEEHREALNGKPTREGGLSERPTDLFKPAIFVANAEEVRRADAKGPALPFPSGAEKVAPSAAGVLAVDWDSDLRTDLVLAGTGGLRFWRQKTHGEFEEVPSKVGLADEILDTDYYGAWAIDIEMDGDLDIVVATRFGSPLVMRNNADGTFKSIEPFAGVKDVRAFVWADLDSDGAPDAAMLDDAGKLFVFANERAGKFSPWPAPEKLRQDRLLGLTAADMNGDGTLDLIAIQSSGKIIRISDQENRSSWQLAEVAECEGPRVVVSTSLVAADMDNNGTLDLVASMPRGEVLLSTGEAEFKSVPTGLKVTSVLDLDGDGRLDVLGLVLGKPWRAINQSKKGYKWQKIWALANTGPNAGDNRINSFALGGEVEIRSGQLVQKQLIGGPVVHFGLGEQQAADIVRIVWPNGLPQWEFPQDKMDIPADRAIVAGQRLGGSCPFLFTFDGKGMRFAGDFMWGTPLGMYVNGQNVGEFPQTTEWLKIPGEHLVAKDGAYDVRVHANLWEVDYFDQLALIVVDHPADTEIHVDERFFLTPTKPKLHVTTPARPVARALDHHGKDARAEVRAIDGRYLDRAGRGRFQGITQDHWVEIDLGGDAPKEGPVLLIARGWLHPTNSSINVAISQGKHAAPQPLSLEVPDGKGGWMVALSALGFPAGKDKTLLIRLDGFGEPAGVSPRSVTRKFRLRTNMEIYWDFLGYAVELDAKLAVMQRPAPLAADLRYRGVLEMTEKDKSSPELPVYEKVIRGPQQWRDLAGIYTRYGDVRELVEKVDDRYVIANAGDEIAFRFPAAAAPGPGFRRDFIWECDGWTRDGDFNTRHGNSVLPLPAHGVTSDERMPGRLEDDPVYRRFPQDWRRFHTRHVTGDEFARGLRR